MAKITGSDLYLSFDGVVVAGLAASYDQYREFDYEDKIKLVDASAGDDEAVSYITALKEGSASLKMILDTAATTVLAKLIPGTTGSLIFGNRGTASGAAKGACMAIVESYKEPMKYDKEVMVEVKFAINGAWVSDPRTATW